MWKKLTPLVASTFLLVAAAMAQKPEAQTPAEEPARDKSAVRSIGKSTEGALKIGVTTEAEKILNDSLAKMEVIKQFRCDVHQETEMLGYHFSADGQLAVAPEYRLLFELKVQLTDTTGSIKEISDGRMHWRIQKILDKNEFVRLDLKKIRELLDKPQFNQELRDSMLRSMGFTGIVPILRGLKETQKFESHDEDTLGDIPVYVLNGQWREEAISQASFRGQPVNLSTMPHIPNKTTLWIGRDNGWPYRVRMESTKKVLGTATTITFEFSNPEIGVQLPESLFAFEPPTGVQPTDQTQYMYQQLSLIMEQQSQAAKQQPAGGTGGAPSGDKAKAGETGAEPAGKKPLGLTP
jgi:outer membrane lipoprotein-sorting protein